MGPLPANSMHPKIRSILALTRAIYVHERANRRYPASLSAAGDRAPSQAQHNAQLTPGTMQWRRRIVPRSPGRRGRVGGTLSVPQPYHMGG